MSVRRDGLGSNKLPKPSRILGRPRGCNPALWLVSLDSRSVPARLRSRSELVACTGQGEKGAAIEREVKAARPKSEGSPTQTHVRFRTRGCAARGTRQRNPRGMRRRRAIGAQIRSPISDTGFRCEGGPRQPRERERDRFGACTSRSSLVSASPQLAARARATSGVSGDGARGVLHERARRLSPGEADRVALGIPRAGGSCRTRRPAKCARSAPELRRAARRRRC